MVGMTWNETLFDWTQLDAVVGVASTIATLVAVGFSVWTAHREHKARIAAEERANKLEDQARAEAERAQASRVFVGVENFIGFSVRNESDLSIRMARAQAYHPEVGALDSDPTDVVDPGMHGVLQAEMYQRDLPEHLWFRVPYAVVFRDDGDRWWARFKNGDLLRLPDEVGAGRKMVPERLERVWAEHARIAA